MSGVIESAHALTAFRILPNGEARKYTATTFPKDPRGGCERFLRMCRAVGWICDRCKTESAYAVLDVLDAEGDIVQDFPIPTARAFQRIKRKLNLAVEAA